MFFFLLSYFEQYRKYAGLAPWEIAILKDIEKDESRKQQYKDLSKQLHKKYDKLDAAIADYGKEIDKSIQKEQKWSSEFDAKLKKLNHDLSRLETDLVFVIASMVAAVCGVGSDNERQRGSIHRTFRTRRSYPGRGRSLHGNCSSGNVLQ